MLALLLAGCSTSPERPPATAVTLPAPDPALTDLYNAEPAWRSCGDGVQCTSVTVPVDWAQPSGQTIDLALTRRLADGIPKGTLVVNYGGPGVPGAQVLKASPNGVASRQVRADYDIVAFDPRGTGASAPVDCLSDRALDEYLAFTGDGDPAVLVPQLQQQAGKFAAGCERNDGAELPHLGTGDVVRDLDLLRSVLDQRRLNYLGLSYGTLIGARYADEFGANVGRFVLDGALDPANGYDALVLGQAVGMEQALRAFVTACTEKKVQGCPLTGAVDDGLRQVRRLLEDASRAPLRTDSGRPLTGALAMTALVSGLYAQASWPELAAAIRAAQTGTGTAMLAMADRYNDRGPKGRYTSNISEAFWAVTCLDYPMPQDPAVLAERAGRIEAAAPVLGRFLTYGELACSAWPAPDPSPPEPVRAAAAPPILVVGTTGDPATPYVWAQSLTEQLPDAVLLTVTGTDHTAYGRGNKCATEAVDGFLLDGTLPAVGTTCSK